MKRRKGLILVMAFVFGGLFFAFTNNNPTDTSLEQRKKLLTAIGNLLEKQHYSPKKIDDAFSAEVFKKYLEEIDGEKTIFLESDIASLQKFKNTIDDEIHGSTLEFVPAVEKIYTKRIAEVISIYQEILSKPFDFTTNENFISEASKLNYSLDENERKDRIRKSMKYFTLERYVDLQEQRSKSIVDSIKNQTDEFLEKDARQKVLKAMDKFYNKNYSNRKGFGYFNFIPVIS